MAANDRQQRRYSGLQAPSGPRRPGRRRTMALPQFLLNLLFPTQVSLL
ncbi:MAG: hypothetical protein ACLS43_10490 [Evtepia gabavorous]